MKRTESAAPVPRPRGSARYGGISARLPVMIVGLAVVVLATGLVHTILEGRAVFPGGGTGAPGPLRNSVSSSRR